MKKLIIILSFLFISCGIWENKQIENTVEENKNIEKNLQDEKISEEKNIEKPKLSWDKNISFPICDGLYNYQDDNRDEYFQSDEIKLLEEKIKNYVEINKDNLWYSDTPDRVIEYCTNNSKTKFIFAAEWKNYLTFLGKFDLKENILETFEKKKFIVNYLHYTHRNYWDISLEEYWQDYRDENYKNSWFSVRNNNIIKYKQFGIFMTGHAESAPWYFSNNFEYFKNSTMNYCSGWLTPGWKLSVCFADVEYDFDFVNNTFKESRVCTYYVDDNGEIQVLEKCINIQNNLANYSLESFVPGANLYQNEQKDVSIFRVDLQKASISFGGVEITDEDETNLKRYKRYYAEDFSNSYGEKNIFAFINGQFFNQLIDSTSLSFPVKSKGKIINSYVDNDIKKSTFVITKNNTAKIIHDYNTEILENPEYSEVIVWAHKDVNARRNDEVWRTYIALDENNLVYFIIAKNKTQAQMQNIVWELWIWEEDFMMMDGGPSSQFAYYDSDGPGTKFQRFYGSWEVPQFFVISYKSE